jgi:hypothetical protein
LRGEDYSFEGTMSKENMSRKCSAKSEMVEEEAEGE